MSYEIHHNPGQNRFETTVDGHECVLDYTLGGDVISMNRVYVPSPVEGRGIAGRHYPARAGLQPRAGLESHPALSLRRILDQAPSRLLGSLVA